MDQREKTIFVNRDANLTCKATGTRIASVQWYKWAKKLSIQQQVVTKELNLNGETWTNTLTLKNVTMDQAGWYECRVFETGQDYGFWSSHEKLKVLGRTSEMHTVEPLCAITYPKQPLFQNNHFSQSNHCSRKLVSDHLS